MKKFIAILMFVGFVCGGVSIPEAKAVKNPPEVVLGSLEPDGWCEEGGVDCAYIPLPPVEIPL